MISRVRIVHRLTFLTASMTIFLVAVTAVGVSGMSSILAGLRTVYEDRTVCLVQLGKVRQDLSRIRWAARDMLDSPAAPGADLAARIEADEREIDEQWGAYMATYLAPDEKLIAARIETGLARYRSALRQIVSLAAANRTEQAKALFRGESAEILEGLVSAIDEDIALQERVGKAEYEKGTRVARDAETAAITTAALALALGTLLAAVIVRSIVRPLRQVIGTMGRLAEGDLSVEVRGDKRGDEVGEIARAVRVFRDSAVQMQRMRDLQEAHKRQAEDAKRAAMREMADIFEAQVGTVVGRVTSSSRRMQSSSTRMASSAAEASLQASDVANSATQASLNVRTVAMAAEELAGSIQEIAAQVERSKTVIGRADAEAQLSAALMGKLFEDSARISEILSLIGDIADQTNLLALNATIEAARAGAAGKGFAVVAAEVKSLARQASLATDQIAEKIAAVQAGSTEAVKAISSIAVVTGELAEIGSSLAHSVECQILATANISTNVGQAASRTDRASSGINGVETAARDTGASAAEIRDISSDLASQVELLDRAVHGFLLEVRGTQAAENC